MTIAEYVAAAEENKKNMKPVLDLHGAEFFTYCGRRANEYRVKAEAAKTEAARAKWNAIADVWDAA